MYFLYSPDIFIFFNLTISFSDVKIAFIWHETNWTDFVS